MRLFVLLCIVVSRSTTNADSSLLAFDTLTSSGAADGSEPGLLDTAGFFSPENPDQDRSIEPWEGGIDTAAGDFLEQSITEPGDLYTMDMILEDQAGPETVLEDLGEDLRSLRTACGTDGTQVAVRRRRDWTWPVGGEETINEMCVPAQTTRQKGDCPDGFTAFCCFGDVSWMLGVWAVKLCNECELLFSYRSDSS